MTSAERWASCGAMALTGDRDGPPLAPATDAAAIVDRALQAFDLDAGVLTERAAMLGFERSGLRSCGGASRLLPTRDGWLALTLARQDDVMSLPAIFELDAEHFGASGTGDAAPWRVLADVVLDRPTDEVVERCRLLGVPAGRVGEGAGSFSVECRGGQRTSPAPEPTVLDLSALWAGPLAASCLRRSGAQVVIKVEDSRRPDGARRGDQWFFDLLNGGKRSVALDLSTPAGLTDLARLVEAADIVVSSSRQRACENLGLDPDRFLAGAGDRVWVAITAHGWHDDRVGFGDDVAATAGLVAWGADGRPRFAADAIADPLGGALAAEAARAAWTAGGRWFIDASLAGAAADAGGSNPTAVAAAADAVGAGWCFAGTAVVAPRVRRPTSPARSLGADTDVVLHALA